MLLSQWPENNFLANCCGCESSKDLSLLLYYCIRSCERATLSSARERKKSIRARSVSAAALLLGDGEAF